MHQDETPFAMPRSSAWDRPSAGTPAASAPEANPFAQSAFDSRSRAASPFADQPELSPGRSTARSAEPARRSAPPFDTRTPGDAAASSNPFRAHPAAGPPVSRRDVGLPSATPTRRSAGLVYGSERESEAPSRRLELPRSSDSPLYYGRDLGQATTAEGRAAGRDVGLTPASGTRSRIPVETGPGGGDPFGEPPGTSISGALDMPAGTRGDEPAPSQAGESKPEKPKRGLFSWFRKRGQSEK